MARTASAARSPANPGTGGTGGQREAMPSRSPRTPLTAALESQPAAGAEAGLAGAPLYRGLGAALARLQHGRAQPAAGPQRQLQVVRILADRPAEALHGLADPVLHGVLVQQDRKST